MCAVVEELIVVAGRMHDQMPTIEYVSSTAGDKSSQLPEETLLLGLKEALREWKMKRVRRTVEKGKKASSWVTTIDRQERARHHAWPSST